MVNIAKKFRAKDKVVQKMTREGLKTENQTKLKQNKYNLKVLEFFNT